MIDFDNFLWGTFWIVRVFLEILWKMKMLPFGFPCLVFFIIVHKFVTNILLLVIIFFCETEMENLLPTGSLFFDNIGQMLMTDSQN